MFQYARYFMMLCFCCSLSAVALEDLERYVLSADKQATLEPFIVGSDEYRYYEALAYQVAGDLDRVDALLSAWRAEVDKATLSARYKRLVLRQQFLRAGDDPEAVAQVVEQHLSYPVNTWQRKQAQKRYPSEVEGAFWPSLKGRYGDLLAKPKKYTMAGIRYAIINKILPDADLADIISDGKGPQRWPRMMELFVPQNIPFHDVKKFFRVLTIDELMVLRERYDDEYIHLFDQAIANKLIADAAEWQHLNRAERLALLDRLQPYVGSDPQFTVQHAFLRLRELWIADGHTRADVLHYLRLPRVRPGIKLAPRNAYTPVSFPLQSLALPQVSEYQEQEFINDCVQEALRKQILRPTDLKSLVADRDIQRWHNEAELFTGRADVSAMVTKMGEEDFRAFREHTILGWGKTNAAAVAPEQVLNLHAVVKNSGRLQLHGYQLDARTVRRSYPDNLPTNVELDGLEPTFTRTLTVPTDPLLREELHIPVPECSKRGLYVLEIVSEQQRIRCVVQIGDMQVIVHSAPAGNACQVVWDDGMPVAGATIELDGRQFVCDDKGMITLPFSEAEKQHVGRSCLVYKDDLAVSTTLKLFAEQPQLRLETLAHSEYMRSDSTDEWWGASCARTTWAPPAVGYIA